MDIPVIGSGIKAGKQIEIVPLSDKTADMEDIHIAEFIGVIQDSFFKR